MVTEHEIPDLLFRDDTATKLGRRSHRGTFKPSLAESMDLLADLPASLGISEYKLAKLIGVPQSHVNAWSSGRWFPSQAYMARMLRVMVDAANGLRLEKIKTYDWEARKPIYFPGWEPSNE